MAVARGSVASPEAMRTRRVSAADIGPSGATFAEKSALAPVTAGLPDPRKAAVPVPRFLSRLLSAPPGSASTGPRTSVVSGLPETGARLKNAVRPHADRHHPLRDAGRRARDRACSS